MNLESKSTNGFPMVARLVTRDSGGAERDGLIVGSLSVTEGHKHFKPGHVYEIVDMMGVLTIREVGPSWVKPTCKTGRMTTNEWGETYEVKNNSCWGNEIGAVVSDAGKYLWLSEQEYLSLCG